MHIKTIQIENLSIEELKDAIRTEVKNAMAQANKPEGEIQEDEYLTRRQASEALGISIPTLDSYMKQGLIPKCQVGRKIKLLKSDVDAFWKSRKTGKEDKNELEESTADA